MQILSGCFANRRIVGIDSTDIVWGFGSFHCLSQQEPATNRSNDLTVTKNIFTIAAGICQYNGNGMRQCPEAIPDDGLLDVVMIEKVSILKVLLNIKNLFAGSHVKKLKEVSMFKTNSLEINTDPFISGEVEGEMLTAGNYRIRCFASAIHFMYVK
jgi:diacylglycerol kinase family enzyme